MPDAIYTENEREDILRTLISVSETVDEADGYIVNHDPKYKILEGTEQTEIDEVTKNKYDFTRNIFGIGEIFAVPSDEIFDNEILVQYRALLSTLIIQRWR